MLSGHFQGKLCDVTASQVYAPTTNAEGAEKKSPRILPFIQSLSPGDKNGELGLPESSNILTSADPRQGPEHCWTAALASNHSQEGTHRTWDQMDILQH